MLAIVNYGIGNLTSILNMFKRIGADAVLTSDKAAIADAGKILIPGVGSFDSCIQAFNKSGLRDTVEQKAMVEKIPVLGICVGAQMMTRGSEEGSEPGLGWVNADTIRFQLQAQPSLKVPNMGWNDLQVEQHCILWNHLPAAPRFYFAHSYHFKFDTADFVTASTTYGYKYPVAFQNQNIYGTQFHPEKSHKYGMKVLENFSAL
jgi:imidazole glycerol-phosphate synthase subunit HisH